MSRNAEAIELLKRAKNVRFEDLADDVREHVATLEAHGSTTAYRDALANEQLKLIDEVIALLGGEDAGGA
ncbi:hypothetical protein [Paraburkholderia youngii]|uniref:hypothetical protein n=1 Tax=Paraburkholderia youngii TaxID=2782701 RepID=UPI003D1F71B0